MIDFEQPQAWSLNRIRAAGLNKNMGRQKLKPRKAKNEI